MCRAGTISRLCSRGSCPLCWPLHGILLQPHERIRKILLCLEQKRREQQGRYLFLSSFLHQAPLCGHQLMLLQLFWHCWDRDAAVKGFWGRQSLWEEKNPFILTWKVLCRFYLRSAQLGKEWSYKHQGWELDLMIFVGLLQLRMFCDLEIKTKYFNWILEIERKKNPKKTPTNQSTKKTPTPTQKKNQTKTVTL